MKKSLLLILALFTVLTSGGCAIGKLYLLPRPTRSAKVVQTWRIEEFVALVEQQLREIDRLASAPDENQLKLPPLFPVTFDFAAFPDLKKVARTGDIVVWYQDKSWGQHIDYICLQRVGRIIWVSKKIWSEKDTMANLEDSVERSRYRTLEVRRQSQRHSLSRLTDNVDRKE